MDYVTAILIAFDICFCHGASIKEQLRHIATKRLENLGYSNGLPGFRKFMTFNPGESTLILGAPSIPSHLPEAEPILPGHTLIRPALGMLKSSVKFPHKDWENGAGVYGNLNSLGITYGGTNERVLYSGFRRMDNDAELPSSEQKSLIVLLIPSSQEDEISDIDIHVSRKGKKSKNLKKNKNKSQREKKKRRKKDRDTTKKKRDKIKRPRFKMLLDGTGYLYDRKKLHSELAYIKKLNLPHLGYDGYSKQLRNERRYDNPTTHEDLDDGSSDVDNEDANPPVDNNPHPKLTWFIDSQDLYNHIKINQGAPDWTELMPAVPKDYDEKEWSLFPTG